MTTPARATTGVFLALGAVLVLVAVGLSTPVAAQATDDAATENVSFGAQVSSFMQSTAAEANDTVDRGMWRASVDDGDRPAAAVAERTERLEDRLSTLENRTDEVAPDGTGPPDLVYTARASALRARLAALRDSIDETASVARRHGVDDADLASLRERAGGVEGPTVADAARNLTDAGRGPPENETRGPGTERGPPGNRTAGLPGERTAGPPGNDTQAGPGGRRSPGESGPDDRGPRGDPGEDPPPADGDAGGPSDGGGDGGPPENGGQGGPADGDRGGPPGDGDDTGQSGEVSNGGTGGGPSGDAGNGGAGDNGPPGNGDGRPGNGGAGPGALG